jgi:hypothetical protein
MIPSRDGHSAGLRLMVLARHVKAGKLRMARDIETVELNARNWVTLGPLAVMTC